MSLVPTAQLGEMTDAERFMFDSFGYLVIPDALTPDETAACLEASQRAHDAERGTWRQIGHLHETEPAIESLLDHHSVLPKIRALLGNYFIIQSTWCTAQPAGGKAGGYHQDGSGVYEFRKLAIPTPLMQLRVGYYLTDQSEEGMGNMVMIPGSHNAAVPLPRGEVKPDENDLPIRDVVCGKPGTALLFHQGVFHRTGRNTRDFDRYTMHIVYSPPWLIPSDRSENSADFLKNTTPLRRALMGEWSRPEEPFGVGYQRPPFAE